MRLLVATKQFDRSERAVFRALHEKGIKTRILHAPGAIGLDDLLEAGIPCRSWNARHRLDRHAAAFLRKEIDSFRPHLIYAPHNHTLAAALRARSPDDSLRVIGYRGTLGHLARWNPASRMTYLHPRLDQIVCVSNAVRRYLLSLRVPDRRLTVIHKGHDPNWYDMPPSQDRSDFGIPQHAVLIGFAGNIRPVKGVDVLLRAVRRLSGGSGLPPLRVLLVGAVRDRRVARMLQANDLRNIVTAPGPIPNAASLMKCFDLFVLPSVDREGLPRALIEAMSQRIACISTTVGGIPELIEDGVSGRLVPPRNPIALADAIRSLATDAARRRALADAARRRVETAFHINLTIQKFLTLFRTLESPPSSRTATETCAE